MLERGERLRANSGIKLAIVEGARGGLLLFFNIQGLFPAFVPRCTTSRRFTITTVLLSVYTSCL